MRRSTVLSLPLQVVFRALPYGSFTLATFVSETIGKSDMQQSPWVT
jgi:hypothetical protein